jgi:aminoglycoside phosphotransferase (APT) family kinase protein
VTPIPDLETVRDFLRDWSGDRAAVDELGVGHVKVGPGDAMRVLYEAPAADGEVLRVVARHTSRKRGRRIEAQVNARCAGVQGFPHGAVYHPELGLLFQVFPADWRLESLPVAVDGAAMAPRLREALGGPVRSVTPRVLRYKPQRKCLLRYDLDWAGSAKTVYARVLRDEEWADARDVLERLWAVRDLLSLQLPEPLAVFEDLRMQVFSALSGEALFAATERADFPDLAARGGVGLSEFHALPLTFRGAWDERSASARIAGAATQFARLLPAQAERIGTLGAALGRHLAAAPGARRCPVHGDFHGDNLLVGGDRVALIDFEDCAMGDPAEDVASNWAQRAWQLPRLTDANPRVVGGREAFLAAYLEHADPDTAARIPVLGAAYLFLNAFQAIRRARDPHPREDAEALLDASAAALG